MTEYPSPTEIPGVSVPVEDVEDYNAHRLFEAQAHVQAMLQYAIVHGKIPFELNPVVEVTDDGSYLPYADKLSAITERIQGEADDEHPLGAMAVAAAGNIQGVFGVLYALGHTPYEASDEAIEHAKQHGPQDPF